MSAPSTSPSALCKRPRVVDSPEQGLLGSCTGSGQHAGRGCLSSVMGEHPLWGLLSLPCGLCVAGFPCRQVPGGGGRDLAFG